jgi:hypothetical protein
MSNPAKRGSICGFPKTIVPLFCELGPKFRSRSPDYANPGSIRALIVRVILPGTLRGDAWSRTHRIFTPMPSNQRESKFPE